MIEDRGDLPPICIACTRDNGLCVRHVPEVCPQLKQPSWHREALAGERDAKTSRVYVGPPDPAVERVRRREDRKRIKAESSRLRRLLFAIGSPVPRGPVKSFAAAWAAS